MKFRLEAAPEELREKSPALIKALLHQLEDADPRIRSALDAFEKAEKDVSEDQGPLRFPVMRELFRRKRQVYEQQTAVMMAEIEAVLKG